MELKVIFTGFAAVFIALRQSVRYSQKNKDCDCPQGGGTMNSDDLRERLLAAEVAHLKTEVITQLCRWSRCRDDRDLLMALRTVDALVAIEDDSA